MEEARDATGRLRFTGTESNPALLAKSCRRTPAMFNVYADSSAALATTSEGAIRSKSSTASIEFHMFGSDHPKKLLRALWGVHPIAPESFSSPLCNQNKRTKGDNNEDTCHPK